MKNILYLFFFALFSLCCNKGDEEVERVDKSLISPSGTKIATTVTNLKLKLSAKFLDDIKEITDIHYLNFKSGAGAIITYKTKDAKVVKCFYATGITFRVDKFLVSRAIKQFIQLNHKESDPNKDFVVLTVPENKEATFKCNGEFCCTVGFLWDGYQYIITCGCSGNCTVSPGEEQTT